MMIKAGTGKRALDIPSGFPLLGHPGFQSIASGTHDPLLATAVHVRTGVHGALFIALDLYGLDPYQHQRILAAVAAATGVHRDRIFMGCTHTHAGPVSVWSYAWKDDTATPGPDSVFLEAVTQTTVAAAAEACATTRPVTLALAEATDRQGTAMGTLAFRQDDGALAALLTVSHTPAAPVAPENRQITAETAFFYRERLNELQSDDIPVIFFAAPSGGRAHRYGAESDLLAEARRAGCSLADTTREMLKTADWHAMDDRSEISYCNTSVSLAFRAFPDNLKAYEQAAMEPDPGPEPSDKIVISAWRDAVARRAHAQAVLRLADHQSRGVFDQIAMLYGTAEALVVRIGSLTLIGLAGNPPPETAARLKQALKGPVFVAAHVNGFLQGDTVTTAQEQRGEFGAMPCPFAVQGMNALAESILTAATP